MRTRMMNLLAELDDGGRYARETTKGLKDWEAGWREETDNATADVERLMEVWA